MPNIYKSFLQLSIKIGMYDKIKHMFMPYDSRKYSGVDFFWRAALSSMMCMGMSTFFVYPFELIHTRVATDMT